MPCLDLLPIFRAKAMDEELYTLRDTHYNLAGQNLAAASIAQFLSERQLLSDIQSAMLAQGKSRE
jgi:hypothetical protein